MLPSPSVPVERKNDPLTLTRVVKPVFACMFGGETHRAPMVTQNGPQTEPQDARKKNSEGTTPRLQFSGETIAFSVYIYIYFN